MKNNRKEKGVIVLLVIIAILMTIGFANFAENLNVNGTVTVKSTKWSVHYDNASYKEATGSVAASEKSLTDTDYTFTATLTKPGDVYEATVDIVNDGSFAANLTGITMSTLTEAQQKYLTYTVTYDGKEYNATTSGLTYALNTGDTKTVKVKVAYIQPENSTDLPTTDTTVTISGSFNYDMAE